MSRYSQEDKKSSNGKFKYIAAGVLGITIIGGASFAYLNKDMLKKENYHSSDFTSFILYTPRFKETVKKFKKENEKKTIRFSAQYHAMTFYEMLGYTKDNDDIFVEVGIEHISMSKIV